MQTIASTMRRWGLTPAQTGGGCTAYRLELGSREILVTDPEAPCIPAETLGGAVAVSVFDVKTGDEIERHVTTGFGNLDARLDDAVRDAMCAEFEAWIASQEGLPADTGDATDLWLTLQDYEQTERVQAQLVWLSLFIKRWEQYDL